MIQKNITARQYRVLADHMEIYQFMLELYEKDWRNGVPAPFLEYALSSDWMDQSYTHRNRIWKDGERIVAFCFNENPVTDTFFSLRPGYEELAPEMIAYAGRSMPHLDGAFRLVLFEGQKALMEAAGAAGYRRTGGHQELYYEFDKPLDYRLPEGFCFTEPGELDIPRAMECCWKGFQHEAEEGPWHGNAEAGYHQLQAPHATPQYGVAVKNEAGEYVCYAGMWWTPANHLAYLEPLCTIPGYRRRGLAAAALSELYRRMRPLGATHMTGGGNPFYEKIGFQPGAAWTFWEKESRP